MSLPTWANSVTPFSKLVALALFIFLPFLAFYLGIEYQKNILIPNVNVINPINNPKPTSNDKYLLIPEWNIRVKMGNTDPTLLTYTLTGPRASGLGQTEGTALLSLKPVVTSNKACQSLGIGISKYQLSAIPNEYRTHVNVVGSNAFSVGGAPGKCGDPKIDAIRELYVGTNPKSWEYSDIK